MDGQQKDFDDLKRSEKIDENGKVVNVPPRIFRNSFVNKTLKLFYPGYEAKGISKRDFKENVWWFFVLLIGLILATSFLFKSLQRFKINPTFTSIRLNENDMKVTYPTIDICPLYAIDYDKVSMILSEIDGSILKNKINITNLIPNFTTQKSEKIEFFDTNSLKEISEHLKSDDIRSITYKLAVECKDLIKSCKFKDHSIDCCTNFLPKLTEHGFCYSFNTKMFGSPLKEFNNPQIMSMIAFEDHTLSFEVSDTSKIFMHSREEILSHYHKEITTLKPNSDTNILFSIIQTHTNDDLRQFYANFRKCFFKNERKSKFYANEAYTYSGCLRDLVIEEIQSMCGCVVPYFRPNNIDDIKICGLSDLKCLNEGLTFMKQNEKNSECFLPCDNTVYSTDRILKSHSPKNSSLVTFNLYQWPLISFHRDSRFGFLDFLVTFGSIFALFLGFSLLSLVEILLYVIKLLSTKFNATKSHAKNCAN